MHKATQHVTNLYVAQNKWDRLENDAARQGFLLKLANEAEEKLKPQKPATTSEELSEDASPLSETDGLQGSI